MKIKVFILLTIMIWMTFGLNTYAYTLATEEESKAYEICSNLGILKGGIPEFGIEDMQLEPIPRITFAVLMLRTIGLDDLSGNLSGKINFSDANDYVELDDRLKGIISYLKEHPELGYKCGIDFEYEESMAFARFIGLKKFSVEDEVDLAEVNVMIVNTLNCKVKGDNRKLIEVLLDEGKIKNVEDAEKDFDISATRLVKNLSGKQ